MDELNLRGTEFFRLHVIENPSSPEKIVNLGERMRLTPSSRVVDVGAGTCGPAILLATTYGCAITCVELEPEPVAVARSRIERAGLVERIRVRQEDATDFDFDAGGPFDAAMCLGACWIYGSFEQTAAQLRAAVVPSGYVALGDVYRPIDVAATAPKTLEQLVQRLGNARLELVGLIDSDSSDWDNYETLRLHAMQEWLDANPDHPEFIRVRDAVPQRIAHWLDRRNHAGWAILIGRRSARDGAPDVQLSDAGG